VRVFNTEDLTTRELEILSWAGILERNYIVRLLLKGDSVVLMIVELLTTICKLRQHQMPTT
jgi:hypothetical protein